MPAEVSVLFRYGRLCVPGLLISFSVLAMHAAHAEGITDIGVPADIANNAQDEKLETFVKSFDKLSLGQMLLRFYLGLRDNTTVFEHLMQKADILLGPLLGPMIIICAGSRLFQEIQAPSSDARAVLNIFYVTGLVVLLLVLYRFLLHQVTLFSNSVIYAVLPNGYTFEGVMRQVESVTEEFESKKSGTNIIWRLADRTVSLYTQYVLAWTSKWGVMVLHGLLNYARNLLYVLNYVLGMFLLPLLILKNSSLPKNWFMITTFIFLWAMTEGVMVAAIGDLGISALRFAIGTDERLPAFAVSVFYVMITTVNILIGLSLLASIWIVKTYLMSPGSIASMATALALPAATMTRMMTTAATGGVRVASPSVPLPSGRLPGETGASKKRELPQSSSKSGGKSGGSKAGDKKPKTGQEKSEKGGSATGGRSREPPMLTTVIKHRGKLDRKAMPDNVYSTARVAREKKIPRK